MTFEDVFVYVKDYYDGISEKQMFRAAKSIIRQINSKVTGQLKTYEASTGVVNKTITATFSASNDTVTDDDGNGYFGNLTSSETLLVYGSDSNDGVYDISSATSDVITISGSFTDETSTKDVTIVGLTLHSDFSIGYDDTYEIIKLTLPNTFVKMNYNGLMVDEEIWKARELSYLLSNVDDEAYAVYSRTQLALGLDAFSENTDLAIKAYFKIPVPSTCAMSTTIDIPGEWEECLNAGILGRVALMKKDEDVYKGHIGLYRDLLLYIERQEMLKFPAEEVDQVYNYNDLS